VKNAEVLTTLMSSSAEFWLWA